MIIIGGVVGTIISIFIVLALAQIIPIPYVTPTTIEITGISTRYPVNGTLTFAVKAKGYGSNCLGLEVQTVRQNSTLGTERAAYYQKTDDCRFMTLKQGPYNFTRQFEYSGPVIMGKAGIYEIDAKFTDLVNGRIAKTSQKFNVG